MHFQILLKTIWFITLLFPAMTLASPDGPDFKPYRINHHFGVHLFEGSGFLVGSQFGYAPKAYAPFFIGPSIDFSLFSRGNMFSALASGWYELKAGRDPKLFVALGGSTGLGFTQNLPLVEPTVFMLFTDLTIGQELDDLASIRGQFRFGVIGGRVSFMMNFGVSFRL